MFKKEEEGYVSEGGNPQRNLKVMSLSNSRMKVDFRKQYERTNDEKSACK